MIKIADVMHRRGNDYWENVAGFLRQVREGKLDGGCSKKQFDFFDRIRLQADDMRGRTWEQVLHTAYLRSDDYRQFRRDTLAIRDYRCARCGYQFASPDLEFHHENYDRIGRELPEDVTLYCKPCHTEVEEERGNPYAGHERY